MSRVKDVTCLAVNTGTFAGTFILDRPNPWIGITLTTSTWIWKWRLLIPRRRVRGRLLCLVRRDDPDNVSSAMLRMNGIRPVMAQIIGGGR